MGISIKDLQKTLIAFEEHGGKRAAAAALGLPVSTYTNRLKRAQTIDPAILEAAKAGSIEDVSTLSHFWKITKDSEGNGYSLFINNPMGGDDLSFTDMVSRSISDGYADEPIPFEPRKDPIEGEYLLVVDLADVHFSKLCVTSATGYEYNREVARHRVIEGTKALLQYASGFGIGRILFVMGNDALHTEDGKTTTKGTPQDTEGSVFQGFSDAKAAFTDAIKECAKVANVDLLHCMSNHDYRMGWALTQTVAAGFRDWPSVRATDYNISERHRKYYGYGNNAFLLTHGDGTKEEKLYGHFAQEARGLMSKCKNLYALLHHVHHKIRKRRGVDVFQTEKDHNGITTIMTGSQNVEGTHVDVEYVRSPSPADAWHDKMGYINRQGVECLLYHPHDGLKARFTEWF